MAAEMNAMDRVLAAQKQTDGAAPAENPDNIATYTWLLQNVSKLTDPRYYSPPIRAGPYDWNCMVLPPTRDKPYLGIFMAIENSKLLPIGWRRCCEFEIKLLNQKVADSEKANKSRHRFTQSSDTWGWRTFIEESELNDRSGWAVKDTVVIEVTIKYIPDEDYLDSTAWNSKKETGFVGILNQGATCYMNSLLQSLYHIPEFRRCTFTMQTEDVVDVQKSIPLALQRLFYRMQFGDQSVSTTELTKSFGWGEKEGFEQHDVQELNRVLIDNLDIKMKGSPAEGSIDRMFRGQIANVVKALKVDWEARHPEIFYDLSLDVKGCKNIYESLKKYCEQQMLTGSNQVDTKTMGMQDATMGAQFDSMPPVLNLQLKRFMYDFHRDMMVKVNDFYEFPDILELDNFMSPRAERKVPQRYILHSVLVHSGGVYHGHYVVFIRAKAGKWFKFDDEKVTEAKPKAAIQDNYGGDETYQSLYYGSRMTYTTAKSYSAYMLVYVRESDLEWVLRDIQDGEIPKHLHTRFAEEKEEEARQRKERAEAHLYITMQLVREADLQRYSGAGLVDMGTTDVLTIKKDSTVSEFRKAAAEKLNVDAERLRLWRWGTRIGTGTSRPGSLLTEEDDSLTLGQLYANAANGPVLVEILEAGATAPEVPRDSSRLFFKLYDPYESKLTYIGSSILPQTTTCAQLRDLGYTLAQISPETAIDMYHEVSSSQCKLLADMSQTLTNCKLQDGDIIIFQRIALQPETPCKYPTAASFVEFLANRVFVSCRPLVGYSDEKQWVQLELTMKTPYDEVAASLAQKLSTEAVPVDASNIRFTGHMSYYNQPRTIAMKKSEAPTLKDMLSTYYQTTVSEILYFEVLDIPVAALETNQLVKICWRENDRVVKEIKLLVPKKCTVQDVLERLREHVELKGSRCIRMFEVWDKRIYKTLSTADEFHTYGDYSSWHCEEIPASELKLPSDQKLVRVAHICKSTSPYSSLQHFGTPFFMVVSEKETGREVKARLREKLRDVSDEEWATWKIAVVYAGQPRYLKDDDRMSFFQFGQYGDYLGLEHVNTDPKAQKVHESTPLRIYN